MRRICLLLLLIVFGIGLYFCTVSNDNTETKIPGSFRALELFSYIRAYPHDDIPDGAYTKGFEEHKEKFLNNSSRRRSNVEPMGPLNTTGRTLTIAINPQADSTLYAGSASGGLWRSRSLGLGRSWEYVETGLPVLGVSTIEFAPGDSMTMYIGTGEVYNFSDTGTDGAYRSTRGSYGQGILKSIDGGKNWSKSLDWSYNQKHGVWMIKVSPLDPDIVYAATTEGIYKSVDAGQSWEQKVSHIMATDIDIDPRNDDNVVACFGNFSTPNKGIYTSTDGGENWSRAHTPDIIDYNGKILMARSHQEPNVLYASVGNGFSNDGATQLLQSIDNGASWLQVNNLDYSKWQGWFSHDVAVDPFDSDNLTTVGIEVYKSTNGGTSLIQKNDGGVSYGTPAIEVPDGPPDFVHSDIHFVTYHPNIKDLVLIGTDGGLFLSFDNCETFRSANGGMQTTQFYNGFSVSHTDPDFALGGLQDNSTVVFRGDDTWQRTGAGDGSWTGINQLDNREVYASAQGLYVLRSRNNANSFSDYVAPRLENDDDPLFISPYVVSPSVPRILFAGGEYIYKSDDRGESWTTMNNGRKLDGGNRVFAMDISDIYPDFLCVATVPENTKGAVFFSNDGGISWSGNNTNLPDRVPNDVVRSNETPELAFVCYSGFGTDHLFITQDEGQSWDAYDDGLPDVPGNAIAIDEEMGYIYYGTDIGVYFAAYKDLNGQIILNPEWQLYGSALPLATLVMDLKISPSDQKLWIATHGNGAYRGDLISDPSSVETLAEVDFTLAPNPSSDFINLSYESRSDLSWSIHTIGGQRILTGTEKQINVSDLDAGTYLLQLVEKGRLSSKSFVIAR